MKEVYVYGKYRRIHKKNISIDSSDLLECKYKGCDIYIEKSKVEKDFYVQVTDQSGGFLVKGGFGGEYCREGIVSITDCLIMCVKNIVSP